MLHLQTEIKENSNFCVVEYDNPYRDIRKEYSLKLHSVYSKAAFQIASENVNVSIKVKDSPYVAWFLYRDFKNKSISRISEELTTAFNSQRRTLYRTTLNAFLHNDFPSARFNDATRDEDKDARFFDINLPKNTYLFSTL